MFVVAPTTAGDRRAVGTDLADFRTPGIPPPLFEIAASDPRAFWILPEPPHRCRDGDVCFLASLESDFSSNIKPRAAHERGYSERMILSIPPARGARVLLLLLLCTPLLRNEEEEEMRR